MYTKDCHGVLQRQSPTALRAVVCDYDKAQAYPSSTGFAMDWQEWAPVMMMTMMMMMMSSSDDDDADDNVMVSQASTQV